MVGFPTNLYARWRALRPAAVELRESGSDQTPHERLLQQIWLHQRLRRDALRTTDGQSVLVLHPGFWNREAGPDFRKALLQIGDAPAQVGDVEIDLRPAGWHQHQHQLNPAYRQVRLHVVWEAPPASPASLPTLVLPGLLDASLGDLEVWFGGLNRSEYPAALLGACAQPLAELAAGGLATVLRQAAQVRLELKAAHFEARARQVGWEQALWEGLFAAFGYKHNVWPMRRLAELLPRLLTTNTGSRPTVGHLQARLLGVGGLLPAQLTHTRTSIDSYLRGVWDAWWRDRESLASETLPRMLWRFDGLRPANHPARRLALAAHWLSDPGWLDRLEDWLTAETPDRLLPASLLARWQVAQDEFWSRHWTLRSPRRAEPHPLLGLQRVTDLAMNVVLPWFWSRAGAGKSRACQDRVEGRYFAWPPAQDNAILRLARARLLAGARMPLPRRAADQQGLLQVVRDFCDQANPLCQTCPFPELVRAARDPDGRPA